MFLGPGPGGGTRYVTGHGPRGQSAAGEGDNRRTSSRFTRSRTRRVNERACTGGTWRVVRDCTSSVDIWCRGGVTQCAMDTADTALGSVGQAGLDAPMQTSRQSLWNERWISQGEKCTHSESVPFAVRKRKRSSIAIPPGGPRARTAWPVHRRCSEQQPELMCSH